jgi:hypothetical protein
MSRPDCADSWAVMGNNVIFEAADTGFVAVRRERIRALHASFRPMKVRLERLFATIEELKSKKQVLVVYGSSHWITFSRAMRRRLGKLKIVQFAD